MLRLKPLYLCRINCTAPRVLLTRGHEILWHVLPPWSGGEHLPPRWRGGPHCCHTAVGEGLLAHCHLRLLLHCTSRRVLWHHVRDAGIRGRLAVLQRRHRTRHEPSR